MAVGGTCLLPPLSSGGASVSTLTGSAEAVTRLRLPQIVACGFPALRSSGVGSQHYESLQRPIGQPQLGSEQWDPLYEPIEGGPGEVAACPAAATEHLAPVTHDDPVHPLQCADISGERRNRHSARGE